MSRLEQRQGNANDELDSISRRRTSLAESERELDAQFPGLEAELAEREGLLSHQEAALRELQGKLGGAEEELARLRALTQGRRSELGTLG
jgi:chromosome segregation ATPase